MTDATQAYSYACSSELDISSGHLNLSASGGMTPQGLAACTCRWWTDHRGTRGPRKHVLAAQRVRNQIRVSA